MSTVLTVYNNNQPRNKCWFDEKRGVYYLIGNRKKKDSGGVYKLRNGKYASRKFVVWSNITGEYIKKSDAKEVIISSDGSTDYVFNNVPIYTIIDTNNKRSVKVHKSVDEEEFALDYRTGLRYIGTNLSYLHNNYRKVNPEKTYENFPTNLYNFADLPQSLKQKVTKSSKKKKQGFRFQENLFAGLNGLSVGVELETCFNLLPEKYLSEFGFLPVRDGSIKGNEFVSLVFQSENDLANIYGFCEKLSKYAKVDSTTSLHIHVGNVRQKVKDEKLFVSALYWLYYQLQTDIKNMIPDYKTDFNVLAKQRKDYCKPLRDLGMRGASVEDRFNTIFKWCNNLAEPCDLYNPSTRKHRLINEAKWHHLSRYYHLNFMNWFFSDSNTIEFRAHQGTVEPERVLNWLAICGGIINFAIKHAEEIITGKNKYDISDILYDTYDEQYANHLNDYVEGRKKFFNKLFFNNDNGLQSAFVDEGINKRNKKKPPIIKAYDLAEFARQERPARPVE